MAQLESISEGDLFLPGVMPFIGKNNTLAKWYIHYAWHDGWGRNQIYNALVRNTRSK